MAKESFTPTGVANKMTALYALSNPALAAEAASIEADIRTWLGNNFNFTGAQTTYLSGMDDDFLEGVGQECGLCFRNRLVVDLVYPAPPGPGMIKYTCPVEKPTKKADGTGNVIVSGKLTIEMQYV